LAKTDTREIDVKGSSETMFEPMHKEIGKRFLKGIAASPGNAIGKAHIFQDILLMVDRRSPEEIHAEGEVTRLKQTIRQVIDELLEDNFQRKQRSFSPTLRYLRIPILLPRS
jgi:hypothetical protein